MIQVWSKDPVVGVDGMLPHRDSQISGWGGGRMQKLMGAGNSEQRLLSSSLCLLTLSFGYPSPPGSHLFAISQYFLV